MFCICWRVCMCCSCWAPCMLVKSSFANHAVQIFYIIAGFYCFCCLFLFFISVLVLLVTQRHVKITPPHSSGSVHFSSSSVNFVWQFLRIANWWTGILIFSSAFHECYLDRVTEALKVGSEVPKLCVPNPFVSLVKSVDIVLK